MDEKLFLSPRFDDEIEQDSIERQMNTNSSSLALFIFIFLFILLFNIYKSEAFLNKIFEDFSYKRNFNNPSFIKPWEVPAGIGPNSFTFENGVCDPQALPPSWRQSKKLTLGFLKKPKCPTSKFLIIINSAPKNLEFRNLQRFYFHRLPSRDLYSVFFILGRTEIELEDEEDIIIGDFKDCYENLVLKTKSAYEYFESCEEPEFFMIQDDDVWSDPAAMMEILDKNEQRAIWGAVLPRMDVHSGWAKRKGIFVEHEKWPYWKWPKYIYGAATFMRREAALAISEAASTSEDIIYIPIEDAVFTGVLRIKACVGIEHEPNLAIHFRGKINNLREKILAFLKIDDIQIF